MQLFLNKTYKNITNFKFTFFFAGGGELFHLTRRAMNKNNWKEVDETIRAKIEPFLYNNGKGGMVPIAHLACLRNRDRAPSKQFPFIKEMGEEVAFSFVFEGSDLLASLTEGLDPKECKYNYENICTLLRERNFP